MCRPARCCVYAARVTDTQAVADDELTVDELAARTGMTVRTVRFYASEGLIPSPARRGRIAYYDARHRMRLDLIRTLQEHGYTLAAIERVLERVPHDATPAEYSVQSAVLAPWLTEQTEELDRAELDRRIGWVVDDGQLTYLTRIGAVAPVEGGRFSTSPSLLGHAVQLLNLEVPQHTLQESAAIISEHATAVAEGLTELFARSIWGPYQRGEMTSEQVAAMLQLMRPLALQGLIGAFARAADDAAHRRLES